MDKRNYTKPRGAAGSAKSLYQYNTDGKWLRECASLKGLEKAEGLSSGNLRKCCNANGEGTNDFYRTMAGSIWFFKSDAPHDEEGNPLNLPQKGDAKERAIKIILQFDKTNNFIKRWNGVTNVENDLGFNRTAICSCCDQNLDLEESYERYDFIWRYGSKDDIENNKLISQVKNNTLGRVKNYDMKSKAGNKAVSDLVKGAIDLIIDNSSISIVVIFINEEMKKIYTQFAEIPNNDECEVIAKELKKTWKKYHNKKDPNLQRDLEQLSDYNYTLWAGKLSNNLIELGI